MTGTRHGLVEDVDDVEGRRPGRPRSVECDRAILQATLEEYARHGYEAMSVDAVAARAGVSKATIYRRHPSKLDLVMTAAAAVSDEAAPRRDTGSLRGDLEVGLTNLAGLMNDPALGRAVRMVVADATRNDEFEQQLRGFVRQRRRGMIEALQRGVVRGELRAELDPEVAVDLLSGPLFYRHLVSRMPVDAVYVSAVIDAFLRAHSP